MVQKQALERWYDVGLIARQASLGRSVFLVALDDTGAIVGYTKANHRNQPGEAELFAIYVLPEHQRRGVGALLLGRTLAILQATKPVERLYVQVERDNAAGREFYRLKGFSMVREFEEDLFDHRSPMVEMCLQVL